MTQQLADFGISGNGLADNSAGFVRALDSLTAAGGGTLQVPDGVYGLSQPLALPWNVSLAMTPGATLLALPGFTGEAVVLKGYEAVGPHREYGSIRGGVIDGGGQAVIGIKVVYACRLDIADLLVRNACRKGIEIAEGWYEVNVSHVRCALDPELAHCPESVGLHYGKCTDSLIHSVVIIGYETGVRSDSSSNDFQQVHVWNFPGNGPLKYCFYCNGWNDSYNQCYADSPFDGDHVCYGYYMAKPFNRVANGRIYCNSFATAGRVTGVFITPDGTHGTYMNNVFMACEGHGMNKAFDGNFDAACIFGNTFEKTIMGGHVCQIPSGGGGDARLPVVTVVGDMPVVKP